MKANSPSLLLPAAAILSAASSLCASAAPDPGAAALQSVGRSMNAAAQQDKNATAAPSRSEDRVSAREPDRPGIERPEDVVFKFSPPSTTRRRGHPEDPDLKLTERERAQLDEIGGRLVDFVDSADRIETNRTRHEEELERLRHDEADAAHAEFAKAKEAREGASADLLDARSKFDAANMERDAAQREFDAADSAVNELKKRIDRDYKEIGDKNKAIAEAERGIKAARDAEPKAQAAAEKARAAAAAAKDALAAAVDARDRTARDADSAAAAAKTAGEKAAAAAAAVVEAEKQAADAIAAAETARASAVAEAKHSLDAAKEAAVKADSAAASDAKAAKVAKRAFDRADRASRVAEAAVGETAAEANAAKETLEARRPKDGEKPGFFRRWSLARAERRAAAAAKAAAAAAAAAPKARQEADALKTASDKAATAATESATKAKTALASAESAAREFAQIKSKQDEAVKTVRSQQDGAVKATKSAARAAEEKRDAADKVAVAAKNAAAKAVDAVPAAEQAATEAKAAAEAANDAADAAKALIAERTTLLDRIKRETDEHNIANIRLEGERNRALDVRENKRDALTARETELAEIGKIDIDDKQKVFDAAKDEEERARKADARARESLNAARGDAYYEAMKDEKALENENRARYDAFWNDYRMAAAGMASDAPAKVLDEAKAALERARSKNEQAASGLAKAKEAARAGKTGGDKAALADAQDALEKAENHAKVTAEDLRKAERALKRAEDAVRSASADADRAVDVLKAAFDEQVAATQQRKRNAVNWILMGDSERVREAARRARLDYLAARRAYRRSRDVLAAERARYAAGAVQWNSDAFAAARRDCAEKRRSFEKAEETYNEYFSDSHVFSTLPYTDEQADARLGEPDVQRLFPGNEVWRIVGDRRWLARTSVNGEPLLDTFVGEMEWQADALVDAGKAARDENDPSRVLLTHDQAVACARAACDYVRRRAVYGGFYFAGLDVDPDANAVFVDKGRYGPITVEFRDKESRLLEGGGRMFSSTNVMAKLGADLPDTPFVEGGAFNFNAFRRRFYDFNANPDVEKADIAFQMLPPDYDYGYEDEDESLVTNRTTRAVGALVTVREKPWPAPLHGTVGIDNFNSMGDTDKPMGEADTWMARATLQTLDLWGLGHALTLSGNYSLGGSLFGGAASYYVPRADDRTWGEGTWRRLDGWSWTVHGGYTDVDQGDVIKGLDVLGTGYYAGLMASSRMVDFGASTLDFSLGLTWRYVESAVRIENQKIKLGPGGDGYTVIPLTAALLYADKDLDSLRGRNYATLEFSYNAGGSSDDELMAFRPVIDDANYFLARLQLARLQLLWEDAKTFLVPRMLFLRADAQWASTPVIGAEQYGLGGHSTVRGYAERQFMGDSGASGTVEFRTPVGLGWLDRSKANAAEAADRLQFVYFLDFGWYTLDNGSAADEDEVLYSVGLGLRYSYDDLVLRFDWGVPLARDDDKFETSSAGVGHASLNYQF